MSVPNMLTLVRVILIPVFFLAYYMPVSFANLLAAAIFSLAAITDWLDGYLARTLKQTTRFGAFLDPVADKLIVATALVMLVGNSHLPPIILPAAIIIGREIAISALREWMAELGSRTTVAVSFIGKAKTALQLISIIILLAYHPSSVGRAQPCQGWGREFESRFPLQVLNKTL